MTRFYPLFLFVCFWTAPVLATAQDGVAQPYSEAQAERLFSEGKWQEVVHVGERLGTANSLALAARAVLADAADEPGESERLNAIARAMALTDRALALNRTHAEALLQSAAAYGFRAFILRSARDAREARHRLDRALMVAPANPYVLAGLGTWHGNAVLEAGGFFGRLFLGAKRSFMHASFESALAIAPDILSIRAGYGLLLVRFKKNDEYRLGWQHLQKAASMTPRSAFERRLLNHISLLLRAYDAGTDQETLRHMANAMAPFSGRSPAP